MTAVPRPSHPPSPFAAAHIRFARVILALYLGTAATSLVLHAVALIADRTQQRQDARETLLLQTELRAHYLARHLGLLASELRRLGLRSEVDLLDQNMEPERSLLRLSHQKSTFFNVGVAILSRDGVVVWSEPDNFLQVGKAFGDEAWFRRLRRHRTVRVVTIEKEHEDHPILYLVSPIVRNGQFTGALLGAIDLARGEGLEEAPVATGRQVTLVATHEGAMVYPPKRPENLDGERWKRLFSRDVQEPFVTDEPLFGEEAAVAVSPVLGSDLLLMTVVDHRSLFARANSRFVQRLVFGLALALLPLGVLLLLLRRSVKAFQRSQEDAAREERLQRLEEAMNLIAHEIKNSLNGIRLGLDLVLADNPSRPAARRDETVKALRSEIGRLADFTNDLLTFAKGIVPRPVDLDLGQFTQKLSEIFQGAADEARVMLDVKIPSEPLMVRADPVLIHVVLSNLVENALEALASGCGEPAPRLEVEVERSDGSILVHVRDNGPGVPAELADRLFEPFVTGKPNGTGLGLALSRKIARAHGGDLTMGHADKGAHFILQLPEAQHDRHHPGR